MIACLAAALARRKRTPYTGAVRVRLLCLLIAALTPVPAVADPASDRRNLTILRDLDGRLAAIGRRLAVANVALCRDRQPSPGLLIHALDQYAPELRPAAQAVFRFERGVSVEAVLPGSPAAAAGVVADEGLAAIDGTATPAATSGAATSATRDAVIDRLATLPVDRPLHLTLVHDGATRMLDLPPSPACRAAFEVLVGDGLVAQSDGRIVQVGARYFAKFRDDQIAVIVAHELAHVILRHRSRLEAAGVHWGVLGEFGRNARLFRRTEDEADALGAVLLHNAGYDPAIAIDFWRHDIGDLDGGIFHSRTHAGSGERARNVAAALAAIPAGTALPYVPPVLATIDEPLR